ncbi:centromere protein P [Scleropages formosus]|uniref:Centromere protein P n=1 Tax=Scleropages formosus TaxID=113540 RepID=A0A8C9R208_SCLFO|nr:centromere protein P [Scleropages formosus]
MERMYEADIKSLQEEIGALQHQLENNENMVTVSHEGPMEVVLSSLRGKPGTEFGKKDMVENLVLELERLEGHLSQQERINRIVLTDCRVKTLERNKSKFVQQHRLSGYCCHLAFQVEFELTEFQDPTASNSVTSLNVVVDGPELREISTFVSRVEDDKSLLLFFRTFREFSERCEHRNRTFMYFKDKYPNVVCLPEGCRADAMTIRSPKLPGCTMNVVWSIDVSKEGLVTPRLELLAKMPEQALSLDRKNVIKNAPDFFQSLLRVVGVEASIDSLIKAVSME